MPEHSYGVTYIAYGDAAGREANMSATTLRTSHRYPVAVIGNQPIPQAKTVKFDEPGWGARWAKLNLDTLSPFDDTLYLDADTRVRGDLSVFLCWLDHGFDLVIGASGNQAEKALWHVTEGERERTLDEIGFTPVQLQAGIFAFRKSPAISALFSSWRAAYKDEAEPQQDQAAFLRALYTTPVRMMILSRAFCDMTVSHLFGKLRHP